MLYWLFVAVVLGTAGSNLLAWLLHLDRYSGFVIMRFNTALALTCGGLSLWLWRRRSSGSRLRNGLASGLGLIVALIGGLTTLQYLAGWDLHIDELFIKQTNDTASRFVVNPGRMSLNAALTFFGQGLALALLDFRFKVRHQGFSLAPGLALHPNEIVFADHPHQ